MKTWNDYKEAIKAKMVEKGEVVKITPEALKEMNLVVDHIKEMIGEYDYATQLDHDFLKYSIDGFNTSLLTGAVVNNQLLPTGEVEEAINTVRSAYDPQYRDAFVLAILIADAANELGYFKRETVVPKGATIH